MKIFRYVMFVVGVLSFFSFVTGCTGTSHKVESCNECEQDVIWRYTEYCVMGEYDQLYCANPCGTDLGCRVDHWCVPLMDQGTWYDPQQVLRWVCMPKNYYDEIGRVYRVGGDCGQPAYECPLPMTCVMDDYNPSDVLYFCSDDCLYDSDCLTGCCEQTYGYCAPYYPYCS